MRTFIPTPGIYLLHNDGHWPELYRGTHLICHFDDQRVYDFLEMVVKDGMKPYIMFLAEFGLGTVQYTSVMMAIRKDDLFICSLIINTGHRIIFKIGGSNRLEEFFGYEESVRASIEPLRGFEQGSNFTVSYEVPSMWGMTTQEWTFEKDPTDPHRYRGYVDGDDMGVFSVRQWVGKMEYRYNKAL